MAKWRRHPVIAYGVPLEGGMLGQVTQEQMWWVDYNAGSDAHGGRDHISPMKTITKALSMASADDIIMVAPGTYIEAVTVLLAKDGISIVGMGGPGQVIVTPSATDATALTVIGDNLTVHNVVFTGKGTGSALINYGANTQFKGCRFTGGTIGAVLIKATVAQALTHGSGERFKAIECEFDSAATGITLNGTDAGALDDPHFIGCHFHDHSAAAFEEAGGTASDRWDGLRIHDCLFSRVLAGTEPTKYISLDDDNGNSGVVSNCVFPTALAGGLNLVSTLCIWVSNSHTGGLSNGQPS